MWQLLQQCHTKLTRPLQTVVQVTTSMMVATGALSQMLALNLSRQVGHQSHSLVQTAKSSSLTVMVTCSASSEQLLAKVTGHMLALFRIIQKAMLTQQNTQHGQESSHAVTTTTSLLQPLFFSTQSAQTKQTFRL